MLNTMTIMGKITHDPELRHTSEHKPFATFTVAVDRDYQDVTDFIDCIAFGKAAMFVVDYFAKGSSICCTGSLQMSKWTDKYNQARKDYKLSVTHSYFAGKSKRDTQTNQNNYSQTSDNKDFVPTVDGDNLPWED